MNIYPLTFNTIYKDKIWGGKKIKTHLGKDFSPLPNCGETWEISAVEGNVSTVANGALHGEALDKILAENPEKWLGQKVVEKFGQEFPLLIKFIDAAQDLSVQVHPDDEMAAKRHQGKGKTEMWYIMESDPGATLIDGFAKEMSKESYSEALNDGKIMEVLQRVSVEKGDVFYIPAGRVHTIGKGIMLAEIQQTSDITYRIYDFDRVDDQGNKRELHTELALDALDFKFISEVKSKYNKDIHNEVVEIVKSPYFSTNKLQFTRGTERNLTGKDSFKIYICLDGEFSISNGYHHLELKKGQCALVPAIWEVYQLATVSGFEALETYID